MKRILLGTLLVLGFALAASARASGDTTITGTLVARNPDSIVVRTVEGERTFAVNDVTSISGDLALDSQVTVTYRESGGMAIASQVLPALEPVSATQAHAETTPGATSTAGSVATGAPAPGTRTMTGPAPAAAPSHENLPAETASAASATAPPAPAAEALPSTASELPLLALMGIVMLTASLLLRWAR